MTVDKESQRKLNKQHIERGDAMSLEETQRIAKRVAQHFVQKVPWAAAHAADLMQEAIIAVLGAQQTYKPEGSSWPVYAEAAASYAVRGYLHRNASCAPRRSASLGWNPHGTCDIDELQIESPSALPSALLDEARLQRRLGAILRRLDDSFGALGVQVKIGGKKPAEVRAEQQCPMEEVRHAVALLQRRAERSPAVRVLAKDFGFQEAACTT